MSSVNDVYFVADEEVARSFPGLTVVVMRVEDIVVGDVVEGLDVFVSEAVGWVG